MNMVMKVLLDHRESCEEQGRHHPCNEERSIKVKISSLSEAGMLDNDEA